MHRLLILAALFVLPACSTEAAIEILAVWGMPQEDRPKPKTVFIHPSVLLPDGSRVVGEPLRYDSGGKGAMEDVPTGRDRVVELVVREGPEAGSPRCCSGASERLELRPGQTAEATVVINAELNLQIDDAEVSWIRSPVGRADPEDLGRFTVPAGPYFAVAPLDGLADTDVVAGRAIRFAGFIRPRSIELSNMEGTVLSTATPNADGDWPRSALNLGENDPGRVFVTALDSSGARSDRVEVRNVWDVTTTAPGPAAVYQTSRATDRPLEVGAPQPERSVLGAPDGESAVVTSRMTWRSLGRPGPRGHYALALDTLRERVVMFGGNYGLDDRGPRFGDTWEFDGERWQQVASTAGPSARYGAAMAYHRARGQMVLFGGDVGPNGTNLVQETWVYDGETWSRLNLPHAPSPRYLHAMAYDVLGERILLYGGVDAVDSFADTWAFDGEAWVEIDATVMPPRRSLADMVYDEARAEMVLYGGYDLTSHEVYQDTWTFDGEGWTQQQPAASPGRKLGHALGYFPGTMKVVLLGGSDTRETCCDADTWTWDGSNWRREVAPTTSRADHRLAYHPGSQRLLTFGGITRGGRSNDTLAYDGTWSTVDPLVSPSPRDAPIMVEDPGRRQLLLVGGEVAGLVLNDAWRWDGASWSRIPSASPLGRSAGAATYDAARDRVVLFGGLGTAGALNDIWEWDGAAWTQMTPTGAAPAPRFLHAMAYDAARGVTVLYGGTNGAAVLDDEWTWDGSTWVDVTDRAEGPGPRWAHALTYDAARQDLVLHGGATDLQFSGVRETWVRNGGSWRVAHQGTLEERRAGLSQTYDSVREVLVRFGGMGSHALTFEPFTDTWEWNGVTWRRDEETGPEPPQTLWLRRGAGLAYDSARDQAVMFGGVVGGLTPVANADHYLNDTVVRSRSGEPGFQMSAPLHTGRAVGSVGQVMVRGYCGASSAESGASLVGFVDGRWMSLANNESPHDGQPPANLLVWSSPDSDLARAISQTGQIDVQCRASAQEAFARLGFDYGEIRVLHALE